MEGREERAAMISRLHSLQGEENETSCPLSREEEVDERGLMGWEKYSYKGEALDVNTEGRWSGQILVH